MPLGDARQLPLAVLARRSGTVGAHATVDDTRVALPVAVRGVVVGVSVGRPLTRLEEAGSRSVGDALLRVVAYRAGTLVAAGVAVVEEFFVASHQSLCGRRGENEFDDEKKWGRTDVATAHCDAGARARDGNRVA